MAGTYLPGSAAMRFRASAMSASRSPKSVAPVGHASAHAVCLPARTRSGHMMHLRTRGIVFVHSYFGTPNGQATMQYRQPMHLSASYETGPSLCLTSAPTGQTETQVGSRQFMQSLRMYFSPPEVSATYVNL